MHFLLTTAFSFLFGFHFLQTPPYAGGRRHTNSTSPGFQGESQNIHISRAGEDHESEHCGINELRMRQAVHSASPVTERHPDDSTNVVFGHDDPTARDHWDSNENDGVAMLVPEWHLPVGTGARGHWLGAASALVATGEIRSVTCCDLDKVPQVTPENRRVISAITPIKRVGPQTKAGTTAQDEMRMIDTIRGRALTSLDETQVLRLRRNELSAWTTTFKGVFHSQPQEWVGKNSLYHNETNLRAGLKDNNLEWVECSLPKMLSKHNGFQLKNPIDLHRSRAAFDTVIQTLMPRTFRSDVELDRLDLALNLHLNPRDVLAIHQHARHPRIRREVERYYNEHPDNSFKDTPHQSNSLNTVLFGGVNTRILLYDKVRQTKGFKGQWPEFSKCVRVEIQLKKKKHIAKMFGLAKDEFMTLHRLDFQDCYRVYRNLLLEFERVALMPALKPNTASFLAILQRYPETWKALGGVEPMHWYGASKAISKKQLSDVRRKVRGLELQLHDFRWADVLPEDRLPDIVDVDEHGNEMLITSPVSFPNHDSHCV